MERSYPKSYFYQDPYIIELSISEAWFYQFLIQNQRNTKMGVYELTPFLLTVESKCTLEEIETYLEKFVKDNKIQIVKGYIILNNFLKHQAFNENTMIAILKQFLELPVDVLKAVLNTKSIMNCFIIKLDKYKMYIDKCYELCNNNYQYSISDRVNYKSINEDKEQPIASEGKKDLLISLLQKESLTVTQIKEILDKYSPAYIEKNIPLIMSEYETKNKEIH